jgi:hypothetical protein
VSTATFVATDSSTQGSWRGVYGADGHHIANLSGEPVLPSYITSLTNSGGSLYSWGDPNADTKSLQYVSGSNRIASTWYSGGSQTFAIVPNDSGTHRVSVYQCDWDNGNRSQTITIKEAGTGTVLDSARTLAQASYANGVWYTYDFTGSIDILITNTGSNCVVGGIFFDSAGGGSQTLSASVTENATATASESATLTLPASVTESVTATESKTVTSSLAASVTESVTATATETVRQDLQVSLSEPVTVTVTVSALLTAVAAVTENVSATDSPLGGIVSSASATENVSATDTPVSFTGPTVSVTENVTASDTATVTQILNALMTENVTAIDTVSAGQTGNVSASVTENVSAIDTITVMQVLTVIITENVSAIDALSIVQALRVLITETVSATDTVHAAVAGAAVPDTVEMQLFYALRNLVANRMYPDVAPVNVGMPYITYQQVGGYPVQFLDGTQANKARPRFQINVWGGTRREIAALAATIANTLCNTPELQTIIESEPTALHDEATDIRGSMQDFTFLY